MVVHNIIHTCVVSVWVLENGILGCIIKRLLKYLCPYVCSVLIRKLVWGLGLTLYYREIRLHPYTKELDGTLQVIVKHVLKEHNTNYKVKLLEWTHLLNAEHYTVFHKINWQKCFCFGSVYRFLGFRFQKSKMFKTNNHRFCLQANTQRRYQQMIDQKINLIRKEL